MGKSVPSVPSIARAVALLDLLSRERASISLSYAAKKLQVPKSSLHNICNTLAARNLIMQLQGGQMVLGPHVMMWANAFLARIDITHEFFASWDEMRVLPEETITLSVRDGREVVYIACRNGNRPLGFIFRTGMRLPAVNTATGLAMLSTLPDDRVRELVGGANNSWPKALTRRGKAHMDVLIDELHTIRKRGYSIDRGGVRAGVYCFGAPVFDSRSPEAIAGVAVSVLANEVDTILESRAGKSMQRLASRLTERLGGG